MTDKLTLNVKLSGKKITDVYSILDWKIKDAKVVTSDDLKDITGNKSLLSGKFVKDDDKNIDTNSFALVGVSSLDKIAAGNVVYVYTNSDGISKVEVGTEVATGTVQNYKSGDPDKFNIGTKTYKNAQEMVNEASGYGNAITDENVGDDVKASLDANGFVFDFEATDGGAKNIAVVEKFDTGIDDQVRIFTAAGKSEVHTYDKAKLTPNSATNVAIGYGLNKDGKITSTNVENSGANVDLKFKSNSVVTVVDKDKVIAVVVPKANANASTDDVYGVVNALYVDSTDGDKVDRIDGFIGQDVIEGKKADGQYFKSGGYNAPSQSTNPVTFKDGVDLFKIEMDAAGVITGIDAKAASLWFEVGSADKQNSVTVTGSGFSGNATGGSIIALAKAFVAYEVDEDGDYVKFSGGFRAKEVIVLYETNEDKSENAGYDFAIVNTQNR